MSLLSLVAPLAGNLLGGLFGNSSSRSGQRASQQAMQQGMDTIKGYYDEAKGNIQPFMNSGLAGNSALMGLLNDPNSIADSAAYKFRFGQGMDALDNSAAARGGLFGGGHQRELVDFGQGLASQEYGNQWNRLMGLTQLGQNSAMGLGQLGANAGQSIANLYGAQGQAAAQGAAERGANYANMFGDIGGALGDYFGQRKPGNTGIIPTSSSAQRNIGPYY